VNLAVIAAFTAAAISLVNIVVTAWLASGSQFRQWQREEARPITARILALSGEACLAWSHADKAEDDRQKHLQEGVAAVNKLRYEQAQLNLIATPPTRQAAESLVNGHMFAAAQLLGALRSDLQPTPMDELTATLEAWERALIDKFRADLGVPADRRWLRRLRLRPGGGS